MDFELDARQALLQRNARAFLEEKCSPIHVRAMESGDEGFSRELFASLGENGWFGVLVAREDAGIGGGPVELSLLAQEAGRVLLPGPFVPTAIFGVLFAKAMADSDGGSRRLRDIVAGHLLVADALFDTADADPVDVRMIAQRVGDEYVLRGEKRFVQYGASVDLLAVLARDAESANSASPGMTVHLISPSAAGIAVTKLKSVGGEPLMQFVFDGVRVPFRSSIAAVDRANRLIRRTTDLGRLATAAQLVGMSRKLLEMCRAHASARRQFSRPIGSFQVIQHQLVDLHIEVERAQVLLDQAAWLMATDQPYARELAVARSAASDTSYSATHTAGHIYGGYAFMNINDVQLYYRRSKVLELRFGNADKCRAEIAQLGYLPANEELPPSDRRIIPQLSVYGQA